MIRSFLWAGACLPLLLASLPAPSGPRVQEVERTPAVTRAEIESCVRWLAADERLGRFTGSDGAVEAGHWLAARLEEAGVEPAGDDGTFLQWVPIETVHYEGLPGLTLAAESGETVDGVYGVDFDYVSGLPQREAYRIRVARSADEIPARAFADEALVLLGSSRAARGWLDKAGMRGGRGWGLCVFTTNRAGRRPSERPPRGRRSVVDEGQRAAPTLRLRGDVVERVASGELTELRLEVGGSREVLRAFNVVGRIDGVGEDGLADEAIVFSAHYDHIGHEAEEEQDPLEVEGDVIHNGADDDASGCAAVLELAEAFADGPPPARTLIFLFATGEEVGLLGTNWYLDHPAVPLEQTVCNLNFEMIGRPDEKAGGAGKLWLTGFERSNLGESFEAAGLPLVPDPHPDQHFFQRSDNYAFAVRGIVAQSLSSYNLHGDYHRVTDEADRLDYDHMETCIRAALAGARALADGTIAPAWKPGGNPQR